MLFNENQRYFLDGAIGSELERRGVVTKMPLWSAPVLLERPQLLSDIYRDYIRAGADIITTNTFRTQRRTLALGGLQAETENINRVAVAVAVAAREEAAVARPIYIAASITTLEDCYHPERMPPISVCKDEHTEQIQLLAAQPIDLFLLETFNSIAEAEIAAEAASQTDKPFMVSFVAREDGALLNGDSWQDAVTRLAPYKPEAILVNCVPPTVATRALQQLKPHAEAAHLRFGAYANGVGQVCDDIGWNSSEGGTPIDVYVHACKDWEALGATIIGGCCGTTPEYTEHYSKQ
jgi:S-methylmethionine-dependent homocysteine/selenocysteine methylase